MKLLKSVTFFLLIAFSLLISPKSLAQDSIYVEVNCSDIKPELYPLQPISIYLSIYGPLDFEYGSNYAYSRSTTRYGRIYFSYPAANKYNEFYLFLNRKHHRFYAQAGDTIRFIQTEEGLQIDNATNLSEEIETAVLELYDFSNKSRKKTNERFEAYRDQLFKLEKKYATHKSALFRDVMKFHTLRARLDMCFKLYDNPHAQTLFKEADSIIRNSPPRVGLESYAKAVSEIVHSAMYNTFDSTECIDLDENYLEKIIHIANRFKYPEAREMALLCGMEIASNDKLYRRKAQLNDPFDSLCRTFTSSMILRGAREVTVQNSSTHLNGEIFSFFSLDNQHCEIVKLEDIHAEYILIDFWRTTWKSDKKKLKKIQALKEAYGDRLAVVSICILDSFENMKAFVMSKPYSWYFLYDEHDKYMLEMGFSTESYILDKNYMLLYQSDNNAKFKKVIKMVEGFMEL